MPNTDHDFHHDDFEFAHEEGEKLIDRTYSATSYAKDVWNNFKKNKGALIGIVIIVFIVLMAIVGPGMNDFTYKQIHGGQECLVPRVPGLEKLGIFDGYHNGKDQYAEQDAKDVYYWFGSDTQGRDIWTRVWSGTRVSLIIALAAVVIDIVIGMVYGLVSGFFGGMVDGPEGQGAGIRAFIPDSRRRKVQDHLFRDPPQHHGAGHSHQHVLHPERHLP